MAPMREAGGGTSPSYPCSVLHRSAAGQPAGSHGTSRDAAAVVRFRQPTLLQNGQTLDRVILIGSA